MDMNYNFDQNLNVSVNGGANAAYLGQAGVYAGPGAGGAGTFSASVQDLQSLSPGQLQQLQQENERQIQQLASQLAAAGITNPAPPYLPAAPATLPQPGPYHAPQVNVTPNPYMQQVLSSSFQMSPTTTAISPTSPPLNSRVLATSLNGNFSVTPGVNPSLAQMQTQVAFPNATMAISGHLPNQSPVTVHNTGPINGSRRNVVPVPNYLPLRHPAAPHADSYSSSNYSSSTASTPHDSPATPKKSQDRGVDVTDSPHFMSRPLQQLSSPPKIVPLNPISDTASTSSTSGPSSPISGPSSPRSPESLINGEVNRTQIKNKPLHMKTRYPQDKCYTCMKKVYPMEKLGSVRGVVYHKGCFRCNVCHSQLTLKNFFHSQSDQYDLAVYCKSHQPLSSEKSPQLDADSLQIKSALSAPKTHGVITESERSPVHKYSYDSTSRAIEHARHAPVSDLQSGNKIQQKGWSKSRRQVDYFPHADVVRHDEPVPEYDMDSLNRHTVENNPDYR